MTFAFAFAFAFTFVMLGAAWFIGSVLAHIARSVNRADDERRELRHLLIAIQRDVDKIDARVNPKPKKEPDGGPYR